jgi:hypothetical protein
VYVVTVLGVLGGVVPPLGGAGVIGVMQFVPSSSCPLGQVSVAVAAYVVVVVHVSFASVAPEEHE